MSFSASMVRVLARCNGYDVAVGDEVVGSVETPVFSGTKLLPDYLLVRLADTDSASFKVIPPDLIVAADPDERTVFLGVERGEVEGLDEP